MFASDVVDDARMRHGASGENQRYRSRAVFYSSVVSRALVRVASSCARSRARSRKCRIVNNLTVRC